MSDYLYKSSIYIGTVMISQMIKGGANYSEWLVFNSNKEETDFCMEALSEEEAKIAVEYISQLARGIVNTKISEGKIVCLRKL